jgi:hypothetical protein
LGAKAVKRTEDGADVPPASFVTTRDAELVYDGTVWRMTTAQQGGGIAYPPGFIQGFTMTNHTSDLVVGIWTQGGMCRSFDNTTNMKRAVESWKTIDTTWAAQAGGLTSGGMPEDLTAAASTVYHVHCLSKPDGTGVDFGFDTSPTAANLFIDSAVVAAGLTKYRHVGYIITSIDTSPVRIMRFHQSLGSPDTIMFDEDSPYLGGPLSLPLTDEFAALSFANQLPPSVTGLFYLSTQVEKAATISANGLHGRLGPYETMVQTAPVVDAANPGSTLATVSMYVDDASGTDDHDQQNIEVPLDSLTRIGHVWSEDAASSDAFVTLKPIGWRESRQHGPYATDLG